MKIKAGFKNFVRNYLFRSDDSAFKISITIAAGFLLSSLPIWGFQTITALVMAAVFRLNKIVMVTVSNLSQPPVTPVIIFLSYMTGGLFINGGDFSRSFSSDFDVEFVKNNFYQYIIGSMIFSVILALISGIITYRFLVNYRRKKAAIQIVRP